MTYLGHRVALLVLDRGRDGRAELDAARLLHRVALHEHHRQRNEGRLAHKVDAVLQHGQQQIERLGGGGAAARDADRKGRTVAHVSVRAATNNKNESDAHEEEWEQVATSKCKRE